MNLKIIKAGICDSIQDGGRHGFQYMGINPGGAIDMFSMRTVNLLAGNPEYAPVIEMSFPAASVFFDAPAIIAIGGADFSATLNGNPVPSFHPVLIGANSTLKFEQGKEGRWCYLAVNGNMGAEKWLGSYSTHTKIEAGGWRGRLLKKGDIIPFTNLTGVQSMADKKHEVLKWKAVPFYDDALPNEIYVLTGNEWDYISDDGKRIFGQEAFSVSRTSDRMGYTLDGPAISTATQCELISSVVDYGTIQLLPGGQMIVLMAGHQTTGGYPRIAHVIKAHRTKIAQLKEDKPLCFRITDIQTAEQLFLKQEHHLTILKNGCSMMWSDYLKKQCMST
ncbi:MAG: biotin-dependent carboxyltransferase family protein [Chitinophagaceae bacterium]|nr:biotin-dependent carboxyltransferase family protein [Chitinophagaceae bacterium]